MIMLWFVLCLLLGQLFIECFEIDEILILITIKKKFNKKLIISFSIELLSDH